MKKFEVGKTYEVGVVRSGGLAPPPTVTILDIEDGLAFMKDGAFEISSNRDTEYFTAQSDDYAFVVYALKEVLPRIHTKPPKEKTMNLEKAIIEVKNNGYTVSDPDSLDLFVFETFNSMAKFLQANLLIPQGVPDED